MVTAQEEMTYYALKSHTLKDAEREEIRRKTEEFLKWKQNKIYYAKPHESALNRGLNLESHIAEQQRYAIRQPENRGGAHNKEVDLTGKRFGRLVVARRSGDRSLNGHWVCDCDCGRRDQFDKKRLIESRVRQCRECDRLERLKEKQRNKKTAAENDLHGKKFHKLTVLGVSETKITNKKAWDVKCDCGTILPVITYKLTSGVRKSCGKCKNEKKV